MTDLRRRMIEDMKLHGLAPSTQDVYLNAVERIANYFRRAPDRLSEQDLREYFRYLVEERKIANTTLRTQIFGVKFLFDKTLQRPWPTLKFLRGRPRAKLPVVLDRQEAERLIKLIGCPVVRIAVSKRSTRPLVAGGPRARTSSLSWWCRTQALAVGVVVPLPADYAVLRCDAK